MPFISVHVGRPLSDAQKTQIKTELGQKITTLPGKVEGSLMIELADNCCMYFHGEPCEGAYVDVRIYGTAELTYKKAFTEQVFQILEQIGLTPDSVYVTFSEYPNWGVRGSMK